MPTKRESFCRGPPRPSRNSPPAPSLAARFARPREPAFPHRVYRQKQHGPLASTNCIIELRPPTLRRTQPSAARPWSTRPVCECDFPVQTAVRTGKNADPRPHCQLHSPVGTDLFATKAELPPPARDSNPVARFARPREPAFPHRIHRRNLHDSVAQTNLTPRKNSPPSAKPLPSTSGEATMDRREHSKRKFPGGIPHRRPELHSSLALAPAGLENLTHSTQNTPDCRGSHAGSKILSH